MSVTIRGTDNSASNPAVTGTDGDTGLYFPAANQVALATNGTERLRADDAGNILNGVTAIGSANPGMYIQNNQATSTGYNIINTNASGQAIYFAGSAFSGGTYCSFGWNGSGVASGSYVYTNPNVTFLAGGGNNNLQIGVSGVGSIKFYNGATQSVTFDSSGRVLMPYQPAFYAYISAGGSVSGTFPFNLTQVNIGSSFSTSTYRFTAPVAGTYYFSMGINTTTTSGGIQIRKNGTIINGSNANSAGISSWTKITTDAMVTLAAGDYVDAFSTTTFVYDSTSYNFFTGWLIG